MVKVYELARAMGVPSRDLIRQLRASGEWVASHLSAVPDPVVARYLPERSTVEPPTRRPPISDKPSSSVVPLLPTPRARPIGRRRGPQRLTKQKHTDDIYDDPIRNLRYLPEITTRDVAELLGVTQAAVRRWVARGYISPTGKLGPSNLFNPREVLAAYADIDARRKATGQERRESWRKVMPRPVDLIPPNSDAVVDVAEAALLVGVTPATIRSWIHRGQLVPLASSTRRSTRLRLGAVTAAARARRLPSRSARPWRSALP